MSILQTQFIHKFLSKLYQPNTSFFLMHTLPKSAQSLLLFPPPTPSNPSFPVLPLPLPIPPSLSSPYPFQSLLPSPPPTHYSPSFPLLPLPLPFPPSLSSPYSFHSLLPSPPFPHLPSSPCIFQLPTSRHIPFTYFLISLINLLPFHSHFPSFLLLHLRSP